MKKATRHFGIKASGIGMLLVALAVCLTACASSRRDAADAPGSLAFTRKGDEIVVCGQYFHTGAPVVLWTDPGGYDAYRIERRFAAIERSGYVSPSKDDKSPPSPLRYGWRFMRFGAEAATPANYLGTPLDPAAVDRVRGGGWDLPTLRKHVDQFVLHYDVCGTSRQCFKILHDVRGLSVHFMLDIDGTIYQTLDLKERAFHATSSNDRSVGIEIANIGAYSKAEKDPFAQWYAVEPYSGMAASTDRVGAGLASQVRLKIPPAFGDGGVRTKNFVGYAARNYIIEGAIQGKAMRQYDLTPQQYDSLIKLTATLCAIFPEMPCDYPRDDAGRLITGKLDDAKLRTYKGVLGHYHIQENKTDPGPAMQWDKVINEARKLMRLPTLRPGNPTEQPAPPSAR